MARGADLLVRVEDATLSPVDGPVRVVVYDLPSPQEVADALASAGARVTVEAGRLSVVTTPSRLVDATGRSVGADTAHALEAILDQALAAWHAPPPGLLARDEEVRAPAVMGVVNVTPDSFSDGGRFYDPDSGHAPAVEHALALAQAGASIIDVGGESSRPGAQPVDAEEESSRALPVVEALVGEGITVSIDTRDPDVARAALEAGASVVNDISGGSPEMLEVVAGSGAAYVLMHMQGEPEDMQRDPTYDDVVAEVFEFLGTGLARCVRGGIPPRRVAVDPGIGFGKTGAHNLVLLRRLRELTSLGAPLLVGVSRKSFIGRITGVEAPDQRTAGSLAGAALAVAAGAAIVRAHEVDGTLQAVQVAHAVAHERLEG